MMIALLCLALSYLNYFYFSVVNTSSFSRMITQLSMHRILLRDINCSLINFLYLYYHFHSFFVFFIPPALFVILPSFPKLQFLIYFHYFHFIIFIRKIYFRCFHLFLFLPLHLLEQYLLDLILTLFYQF